MRGCAGEEVGIVVPTTAAERTADRAEYHRAVLGHQVHEQPVVNRLPQPLSGHLAHARGLGCPDLPQGSEGEHHRQHYPVICNSRTLATHGMSEADAKRSRADGDLDETEATQYDRQIRLWGLEAQKR